MAHGLGTLIDAACTLQVKRPNVAFLLVGEGAEKESIKRLAESRGLKNVHFVDQQSRERIPAFINASDVCLVLLKKTELFKTVIPTKMLEFMSCARPVILGVDGQAREILEAAQAGLVIEPENADELAIGILQLADDAGARSNFGENARKYILQKYSRERTAASYIAELETLLRTTSGPAKIEG